MSEYCVVVAGGEGARFFKLVPADIPEIQSGPNLVELDEISPGEAHAKGQWSETKSGRNRAASGGGAHGYDDHRQQHEEEYERRYARNVINHATSLITHNGATRCILVAHKRLLGFLRNAADAIDKTGVQIHEVAKDLSKLNPLELHEHLAQQKLLPPRQAPTNT